MAGKKVKKKVITKKKLVKKVAKKASPRKVNAAKSKPIKLKVTEPLSEGSIAPSFNLADKDGTLHTLEEYKGKFVVLFFYPKDDTPGCTIEAKEFSKDIGKFSALGVTVIGISGGDAKSKAKFCKKYDLQELLLSDTDFSVSKAYRIFGEKSFMGRKYLGISRTTFIVDPQGKIAKTFGKVNPPEHAKEVYEVIKTLL